MTDNEPKALVEVEAEVVAPADAPVADLWIAEGDRAEQSGSRL